MVIWNIRSSKTIMISPFTYIQKTATRYQMPKHRLEKKLSLTIPREDTICLKTLRKKVCCKCSIKTFCIAQILKLINKVTTGEKQKSQNYGRELKQPSQ